MIAFVVMIGYSSLPPTFRPHAIFLSRAGSNASSWRGETSTHKIQTLRQKRPLPHVSRDIP